MPVHILSVGGVVDNIDRYGRALAQADDGRGCLSVVCGRSVHEGGGDFVRDHAYAQRAVGRGRRR